MGAFIWPALYNGQPFFFPDTTTYIRGADAAIQAAFKHKSAWSMPEGGGSSAPKSVSSIADKTVLTGRSPYFGALLYLGDLTGGFWLSILVQAAAVLLAIRFALRASGIDDWSDSLAIPALLAIATSAPFFVSLLMPDVFAGIVILVAATLLSARRAASVPDQVLAYVLMAAACAFHDSHVLILAALLALALVRALFRRSFRPASSFVLIAAALVTAALAQAAFFAAVRHVSGAQPLRPPFLMARTIEDGPGYRYIRDTCPGNGFLVCRFADRLPMQADDFLWKQGPDGVFATASPDERRALSAEQLRFVAAVAAHDPKAQVEASLEDAWRQLFFVNLREFHYTEQEKAGFDAKIPSPHVEKLQNSAAYTGNMPIRFCDALIGTATIASVCVLAWTLLRRRSRAAMAPPEPDLAVWLVLGVLVNSAVCGILSGPHERYAERVVWLLPLAALLLIRGPKSLRREPPGRAQAG